MAATEKNSKAQWRFRKDLWKFASNGDIDCIRTMIENPMDHTMKECFFIVMRANPNEQIFRLFVDMKEIDIEDDDYLDDALTFGCVPYIQERLKNPEFNSTKYPKILTESLNSCNLDILVALMYSRQFDDQINQELVDNVAKIWTKDSPLEFLSHPLVSPIIPWSDERFYPSD